MSEDSPSPGATQPSAPAHDSRASTTTACEGNDKNEGNSSEEDARFANFVIPASCIFRRSRFSVSFVNLRPIVPGHVLVMPVRSVPYLEDLTPVEYDDLWRAVRESQRILRLHYSFSSSPSNDEHEEEEQMRTSKEQRCPLGFNVAVQDGPQAGQSVPHVHVHILPRVSGDLERNDDVYEALELWSPRRPPTAADSVSSRARLEVADDDQRRDRTLDEMAQEAALYRSYL